jgi:uncharacterized protein with GYD domain
MATYISTIEFTEQGIQNIKNSCKRANAFKAAAKKMGIKVHDTLWTLGAFDGVILFDAPDEETATAAMLQLGALGNVRTKTARAFKAAEMEGVLAKLNG